MLAPALELAARGFQVFPLIAKNRPAFAGWPTSATSDEAKIREWWAIWPEALVGIHCDGMLVLDIDVKGDKPGFESLMRLELDYGALPRTCEQTTPSGGQHLLFHAPHDIPNSVGKLGPGLDTRGRNGYIVAYGLSDAGIVDAPEWLTALVGRQRERNEAPAVSGTDNPTDVQRAIEFLTSAPFATEGEGGDAFTFATVCRVRDMGLSADTALALLLEHWNPRCSPPWDERELGRKVENAYQYAQNALGVEAVNVLFEDLTAAAPPPAAPAANPGRFRRPRSLRDIQPPPMLIEGLVPQRSIVAICAQPGRSKSEHATGMAYAVATDAGHYLGRAIAGGGWAAAYVDLERYLVTELRLAMYAEDEGRNVADIPVALAPGPLQFTRPADVTQLIADLHALEAQVGRKLGVVVIDSLGASIAGEDTNTAGPASAAGHALRAIRDQVGCAVLVVAHSPKSGDRTVAGSVQFDAIFDVSIFVHSEDGGQTGELAIMKDNCMGLEEAERRVGWQRATLRHQSGERQVKVHRLVAGTAAHAEPAHREPASRAPALPDRALAVLQDLTRGGVPVSHDDWRDAVATYVASGDEHVRRVNAGRAIAKVLARTPSPVIPTGGGLVACDLGAT
jgi:hypothetical protein